MHDLIKTCGILTGGEIDNIGLFNNVCDKAKRKRGTPFTLLFCTHKIKSKDFKKRKPKTRFIYQKLSLILYVINYNYD